MEEEKDEWKRPKLGIIKTMGECFQKLFQRTSNSEKEELHMTQFVNNNNKLHSWSYITNQSICSQRMLNQETLVTVENRLWNQGWLKAEDDLSKTFKSVSKPDY